MSGGNIFLNYRRDDSAGYAGRLFDRLNGHFPDCVFRDVTGIALGRDFVKEIERKLDLCNVLIVVIGNQWLSLEDEVHHRRIDDPNDFVRLEVATGLRRDIRVIPVLVSGARMPHPSELPDDLKSLAQRNALEITEPDFDNDVARLIRELERIFGVSSSATMMPSLEKTPAPGWPLWKKAGLVTALGAAVFLIIVLALAAMPDPQFGGKPQLNPSAPVAGQLLASNSTAQPNTSVPKASHVVTDPQQTTQPQNAPGPATGGNAPPEQADEEFIRPVGNWRIYDPQNSAVDFRLSLAANHQLTLKTTILGQTADGQGTWKYDPGVPQLILSGNYSNGLPFYLAMHLVQRQGDNYVVYDENSGGGIMMRVP
ncbi:MAG: hypothetical protein QOJ70_3368 [Acidobacteriota bacterium]|jgi:hypothetical protein|nr:hypothetical protein [Acidobacteriota bacterium]